MGGLHETDIQGGENETGLWEFEAPCRIIRGAREVREAETTSGPRPGLWHFESRMRRFRKPPSLMLERLRGRRAHLPSGVELRRGLRQTRLGQPSGHIYHRCQGGGGHTLAGLGELRSSSLCDGVPTAIMEATALSPSAAATPAGTASRTSLYPGLVIAKVIATTARSPSASHQVGIGTPASSRWQGGQREGHDLEAPTAPQPAKPDLLAAGVGKVLGQERLPGTTRWEAFSTSNKKSRASDQGFAIGQAMG